MGIDHALERLSKALAEWKGGPGFWEDRLKRSLVSISMVQVDQLPPVLRPRFTAAREKLNKENNERLGSIRATIDQIDEKEATEVMWEFEAIHARLRQFKLDEN